MTLSLKNKFMFPTILLLAIMASAISGTAYSIAKSTLTEKAQQQVISTSEHVSRQISLWLRERESDIDGYSQTGTLIDAASDNDRSLREEASGQLEKIWKVNSEYYELVAIADTDGKIVASSGDLYKKNVNISDRSYFRQSIKGEKSFSEVIISKASGNPVYVISAPLIKNRKISGIVLGSVNLEYMGKAFMDPIKIGTTGYMYAIDEKGKVIAYPDKSRILNLDISNFDFGRKILSEKSGLISYEYNETGKIVGFTQEPTQKWIIASTANENELFREINQLGIISLVLGTGSIIAGAVMIFFLTGSIVTPVSMIIETLESVSSQVATASEELSSAGQSLASNITTQAGSIQEASAGLGEINEKAQGNTKNLSALEKLANEAKKSAEKATGSMNSMTALMKNIMQESQKTFGIIKNIDEIAFQTNLLSLNAAVEAARAGESGAGFAVVAGEVRTLAQKSAESAKNTSTLIESVVAKVEKGGEHLLSIQSLIQNLERIITQVNQVVESTGVSISENAQMLEKSSQTLRKMDETIQASASNAEESAAAAEEMSAQAIQMREIADQLTVLVYGSSVSASGQPAVYDDYDTEDMELLEETA